MTVPRELPPLIETTVRVATWNVWGNFGHWEERYLAIEAELRRIDADVICLQEAWRTPAYDAAQVLAAKLEYHEASAVEWFEPFQIESGAAILSRWPIADGAVRRSPGEDGGDGALFQFAHIEGPRRSLAVFNAMLVWRPDLSHVRQAQVAELCRFIAEHNVPGAPTVLCGDFNAAPDSEEIRMLTGKSRVPVPGLVFYDSWDHCNPGDPGLTWTRQNEQLRNGQVLERRIDFIFSAWGRRGGAGMPVTCQRIGVPAPGATPASDHFGMSADLRY